MIPEFRAWDRDKNKWISWAEGYVIAFNGKIYDRGLVTSKNITLYPYIHRKDKDGNKVYEGSLFKTALGEMYEIYYSAKHIKYMGRSLRDKSVLINPSITSDKFVVIGHIATGGPQ